MTLIICNSLQRTFQALSAIFRGLRRLNESTLIFANQVMRVDGRKNEQKESISVSGLSTLFSTNNITGF